MAKTVAHREVLKATYLTYVNDFLTVAAFADWMSVTEEAAYVLIALGKRYHEADVVVLKALRSPAEQLPADIYLKLHEG